MELNVNTGGEITLNEAIELVTAFRKRYPQEIKASFIGALNVTKILDQPGCIGIRIYNGYDENEGCMSQILVGVDANEKDMTNGVIMDRLRTCPPLCDAQSPLMD